MEQVNQKNRIIESYCLLAVDIIGIIVSFFLADMARHRSLSLRSGDETYMVTLLCLFLVCILYSTFMDYNREFIKRGYYVELLAVTKLNAVMVIAVTFMLFFRKEGDNLSRLVLGYFAVIFEIVIYLFHLLLKRYLRIYLQAHRGKSKVMVIVQKEYAEDVIKQLLANTEYTYEITSAVIWDKACSGQEIEGVPIVADRGNLKELMRRAVLDEALLCLPDESRKVIEELIHDFEEMGVICHFQIDLAGLNIKSRQVGNFAGYTVVTYASSAIDYKHHLVKRSMDIVGSLAGLCILAVFFPFVAIAIKLESRGPVLFSQIRVGKNGRRFKIYKFRSMYMDAEERKKELEARNEINGLMFKIEDDPRVTRVGRFLRKTSIDELPQFYNVLKGDMSLVGTRPPTEDEFEQYSLYYRRRLCMTPGLTGLWQVSGRSEVDNFDDVVKYDLQYIDYWSLSMDLKILLRTVWVVLFGKGAK